MAKTAPQKRYLHGYHEDVYCNLKNVLKQQDGYWNHALARKFAQKAGPKLGPPDGPSFSSAQMARDQNWGRLADPILGPPFAQNCELERGFDNQPAFSKHVLQVPKTIPMATGEVACGTAPFFKLFAALKDVPPKWAILS